jgi:hypothetical protein
MPCTGITIELDELENTTAPVERERVAADAIIEARRSALKSKLRASSFSLQRATMADGYTAPLPANGYQPDRATQ